MPLDGLEAVDGAHLDGLAFCLAAYDILDGIRASPGGIEELRLRRGARGKATAGGDPADRGVHPSALQKRITVSARWS
jgi:hypothetical protein